ncbi:MAG: DUF2029 domain-containing protein [Candidatus Omnitrophica bacterium]|nr:DUF2029 domain-containing protein [Candidatus Omnitrophota bacterium]
MSGKADWTTWLIAFAVFLAFLFLASGRRTPTFWSADNGVKWWQAETIKEKGLSNAFLDYPLAEIDPEGNFQPLGWKFGRLEGDRIRFTYPPFYASLLSLNLSKDDVRSGLFWTTLFAALLIPLFVSLGRILDLAYPRIFALFLLFGTALLPYAVEVNEHLIALFFGLLGWLALYGKQSGPSYSGILCAGLCIGLGGWIREECWIWGAACLFPLLFNRDWRRTGMLVLTLATVFGLGWFLEGALSPETQILRGIHIHQDIPQTSFGLYYFRYRWALLNHWLFSWGHYDEVWELSFANPWSWVLLGGLGLVLFLSKTLLKGSSRTNGNLLLVVFLMGLISLYHQARICLIGIPHISGLFFAMPILLVLPLLPIVPAAPRWDSIRRQILPIMAFCLLLWVLAGSSRGGRQWGPRYFMIVWPFLVGWTWIVIEWATRQRKGIGFIAIFPILISQILTAGYAFQTVRHQQRSLPVEILASQHRMDPDQLFLTDLEYLPAAAVGAGHSIWAVFPNLTTDDSKRDFLDDIPLDRFPILWFGIEEAGDWLPPNLATKTISNDAGFTIQVVKPE